MREFLYACTTSLFSFYFYLTAIHLFTGVVLFPEATLPLRAVLPSYKAAFERALGQDYAPCTIGVVCDLLVMLYIIFLCIDFVPSFLSFN